MESTGFSNRLEEFASLLNSYDNALEKLEEMAAGSVIFNKNTEEGRMLLKGEEGLPYDSIKSACESYITALDECISICKKNKVSCEDKIKKRELYSKVLENITAKDYNEARTLVGDTIVGSKLFKYFVTKYRKE
jgi:hypothetical protein